MSGKIVAIKTEVRKQNWETMMFECQQIGQPVKEWCRQNGINPSTYYTRLRNLREKVCQEIVPIEAPTNKEIAEIKIVSGNITISLPNTVDRETLTSVLAISVSWCNKIFVLERDWAELSSEECAI